MAVFPTLRNTNFGISVTGGTTSLEEQLAEAVTDEQLRQRLLDVGEAPAVFTDKNEPISRRLERHHPLTD